MLKQGDLIPVFEGIDQDGNLIRSEELKGKSWIIYFYPKADTPGCSAESCNLRDHYPFIQEKAYQIIGVSKDSIEKQKKFQQKYNLPFPLIADTERKIIDAFGVWGHKKFMGKEYQGILRTTFLIDKNGIIEKVITNVKTKDHASQILES